MICCTVTEKLDRELFSTITLFTFFQTFPAGLNVTSRWPDTSDFHSPISALVPRPKFMTPSCGAPWVNKSTHARKFGNHVTGRPTDRPSVRTTGIPVFTLTLSSYFGSPRESWLHINVVLNWQLSKQGIHWPVSPDRITGSGFDPSRSSIFWSYPLTIYSFSNDRRLTFTFFKCISNMLCLSVSPRTITILISNWPKTQKIQPVFLKYRREDFLLPWSRVDQAPRLIVMLWLVQILQVSSCVKFMQHHESCLLWQLKLTEFWVSLWCFNCLFSLDVQNEIQLLSRVFSYSWLVCLLGFWLRNASLDKADNLIWDSIVFVFHLAGCVREL